VCGNNASGAVSGSAVVDNGTGNVKANNKEN
jgi:hypothetical protein